MPLIWRERGHIKGKYKNATNWEIRPLYIIQGGCFFGWGRLHFFGEVVFIFFGKVVFILTKVLYSITCISLRKIRSWIVEILLAKDSRLEPKLLLISQAEDWVWVNFNILSKPNPTHVQLTTPTNSNWWLTVGLDFVFVLKEQED